MTPAVFELGTTKYMEDKLGAKMALSHLETLCGIHDGYVLGEPEERAGWTFFKLGLEPGLYTCISERFSDMMEKYGRGAPEEKFRIFIERYLHSKNCNVRVRIVPV